jgi:hypothetical protein
MVGLFLMAAVSAEVFRRRAAFSARYHGRLRSRFPGIAKATRIEVELFRQPLERSGVLRCEQRAGVSAPVRGTCCAVSVAGQRFGAVLRWREGRSRTRRRFGGSAKEASTRLFLDPARFGAIEKEAAATRRARHGLRFRSQVSVLYVPRWSLTHAFRRWRGGHWLWCLRGVQTS